MLIYQQTLNKEVYPLKFGAKHDELLKKGVMYIGGRDRHFRPYIVARPAILLNAGATPE